MKDFIYIGPADNKKDKFSINRMLKYNKQELITRLDIPLNVKAGYAEYSPEVLKEKPNKNTKAMLYIIIFVTVSNTVIKCLQD